MSGIYIPDMEKPKCCFLCPLCYNTISIAKTGYCRLLFEENEAVDGGAIFVGAIAAVACAAAAANSDGDGVDFGGFDGDSDDTGFSDGLEEQEFEDIYDTTAEEVTEE